MAKWKVEAYELRTDGTKHGGDVTDSLLSGKLQLQLNDTNKFSFSIPRVSFSVDYKVPLVPGSGKYIKYNQSYIGKDWRNYVADNANSQYFNTAVDMSDHFGKTLKITLTSVRATSSRAFGFCNSSNVISKIWQEKDSFTYNSASGLYEWTQEITDTHLFFSITDGENPQFYIIGGTEETPDFAPLKTAVIVSRVGSTTRKMFTGIVTDRVFEVSDGIYKYQCEGALGAYKYMPPYRSFSSGTDLDVVLQTICDRFRGTATGVYECFNPTTELYSKFPEIFRWFGHVSYAYFGLELNDSLADIQQSATDAEAFIKAIVDTSCYTLPASFEQPVLVEDGEGIIMHYPLSGVNAQQIRYGRNLISCSIEDVPYVTYAEVKYQGAGIGKPGTDYPGIFYYKDYEMPDTDNPYTSTQLEYYADNQLAQPKQMITASGFDEGILDNGTAFLDMSKYAEVVYLEDGGERSVQAQIASITYNLTNPSQDRVQLGKKIVPLTQR